jgi:hypothetical protein
LRDCDWIVGNSILFGNTRGNLFTPQRDEFSNSSPPVYSCIRGGGGGIGSIVCDSSPFVGDGGWIWDGADFVWNVGDYHLWPGAACIDAGNVRSVARDTLDLDQDGDVQERTPFDLSGGRRFADDPCSADSGVPDPPNNPEIVDMGAYEYRPFDADGDGDVDLRDFAGFQVCFTGDGEGPISWECSYFDVDCDGDIDVTDFAGLRQVFQGP